MKQPFEARAGVFEILKDGDTYFLIGEYQGDWIRLKESDLPDLAAVIAEAIKQIEKEK